VVVPKKVPFHVATMSAEGVKYFTAFVVGSCDATAVHEDATVAESFTTLWFTVVTRSA